AELGQHCERLALTCEELCAGQEVLSYQTADTAQNLNSLRTEIRSIGAREAAVGWVSSVHSARSGTSLMGSREPSPVKVSPGERTHASASGSGPAIATHLLHEEPVTVAASSFSAPPSQVSPRGAVVQGGSLAHNLTALSRLGELRRRLGSPTPSANPAATGACAVGTSPSLAGGPWGGGLALPGR
ncbi:unnamed protein product, partial [Polarella glacialis]